ncbi:hypothetical protein JZU46_00300 [bacterium]|nr:hypothetical protein [bacterium]
MIKVKCTVCGKEVHSFLSSLTCGCDKLLTVFETDDYIIINTNNLDNLLIVNDTGYAREINI